MKVKATGQLRHRFWGDYSAVIALQFPDAATARDCLGQLGPGWKQSDTHTQCNVWVGNSAELEACKAVLGSLGADVDKIDSCAKSIDYGEEFSVVCDATPPEQVIMFV